MGARSVVVEADGGSRGNPGPAAYGALLRDAGSGRVIAVDGTTIGVASNNVAEYSGLIAGLRLVRDHAPDATAVEVRMDSKLVVEQMSGRWKIKHPAMRPLALEASRLAPAGTTYTWVPRAQNAAADKLANEALDGVRSGVTVLAGPDAEPEPDTEPDTEPDAGPDTEPGAGAESVVEEVESPAGRPAPARGWSPPGGPPTTIVLVRHGVTVHTAAKRFSGGLGGDNPPLSEEGRAQVRAAGEWLSPIAERVDAVIASPVRRTRESAQIVAELLGREVVEEPGFAEMEFGAWDGLTFAEVAERDQAGLDAWLGSLDVPPPGGESFRTVQERVLAGLARVREQHAGRTVVVVSHVTPIKTLVAQAMGAPLEALFRMELSPASVSVVSFYADDKASLRLFNALPPGNDAFAGARTAW